MSPRSIRQIIFAVKRKTLSRLIRRPELHNTPVTCWDIYKEYLDIHPTAIIDPVASVKIWNPSIPVKKCLSIGEGSHIFSVFSLVRPEATITIGKRCQLGASNFIAAKSIEIGNDVLMAWGITLMDSDSHSLFWAERRNDVRQCYQDYLENRENFIKNKDWSNVKTEKIVIGDKVWIGFNVAILKGVTIGERSVIGACSVVTEDVPPDCLVMGNPARVVRTIDNGETTE